MSDHRDLCERLVKNPWGVDCWEDASLGEQAAAAIEALVRERDEARRDSERLEHIAAHWMGALTTFEERVHPDHHKPMLREMVDAARAAKGDGE